MPDVQDDISLPTKSATNNNFARQLNLQAQKPQALSDTSSLPPIKYPPFLWEKTQSLIKEIEQKVNTKILVYYTSAAASMVNDDVDYFFSHIKENQPEDSLGLVLVSNGGDSLAAWRIANLLRKYCQRLTVFVPSRCASAATLLSLSADSILFGPAGYLTAIDSSLVHPLNPRPSPGSEPASISVDQINRVKNLITQDLAIHASTKGMSEILFEKIHPIVLGELERGSSLSKLVARNMMKLRNSPPVEEDLIKITDILNSSYPAHGYPIVFKEAKQIGLPAEEIPTELNYLFWELVKLNLIISKKVITNLTPTYMHKEEIPAIIESVGKRTFYNQSVDRRFTPGVGWNSENDKTNWLTAIPDPQDNTRPKVSQIEL